MFNIILTILTFCPQYHQYHNINSSYSKFSIHVNPKKVASYMFSTINPLFEDLLRSKKVSDS